MRSITSSCTIRALRENSVDMDYPSLLFQTRTTIYLFRVQNFSVKTMVFHTITTAVYKPSTNGQCERVVQIVKSALRQARLTSEDPDTTLPRFLLRYRITPHTTTGESPSVLLYGRQLRTRLDLYRPSVSDNVSQKQQHLMNTSSEKCRFLKVGDRARTRLYL